MGTEDHRPHFWAKFVALVLVFGFAIGLIEGGLWILHPTPFHEWMEWIADGHIKGRGKPGSSFKTADGFVVEINNLGYRGPNVAWKPAPGTLRVVTLGGSSTFDYHARGEGNTWPKRLEAHLRERLNIPVEVVNLGLPGFSSLDSKINYLTSGREFNPHVVVMYHSWNDMKFFRPREESPAGVIFANTVEQKPAWERVARYTQIGRVVRNALLRFHKQQKENQYTSLERVGARANLLPEPVAFEWARRNYTDFVRFVSGDGRIPVLVSQATIVAPENYDKPEYRLAIDNDVVGMTIPIVGETFQILRRTIEDVAQKEGAIYVDGFAAVPHDFDHAADHVHLTDRGMDVLGRAVANGIALNPEVRALAAKLSSTPAAEYP